MLTIENYFKDEGTGVWWFWDMVKAVEDGNHYGFEFHKTDRTQRVIVHINRTAAADGTYECYVSDMASKWDKHIWLKKEQLNISKFYELIESIIDDEYPLPF